ncbi:MAG: ABC transporter ATP-binding protein [Deltaproteobacteria bacterium]|nr:ABC transporter ATP-binding protein [Deltaproteobacteria bacterium]
MSDIVVRVDAISKRFEAGKSSVQALNSLSFEIERGEVFALLGPNGSGKTTTLNILSCLLDPDQGDVEVLGLKRSDPHFFDKISFMSGDSEYYWAFTVSEILKFYANLSRCSWRLTSQLLGEFGLSQLTDRKWMMLSNGEKTRLRLVQALMTEPEVLFLDEPTVGLDPDISDIVRTKLKELHLKGLTIFLTSHYMKDIDSLASRVAFIKNGKLLEIAPREDFGDIEQLEQKFIRYAREEERQ